MFLGKDSFSYCLWLRIIGPEYSDPCMVSSSIYYLVGKISRILFVLFSIFLFDLSYFKSVRSLKPVAQ